MDKFKIYDNDKNLGRPYKTKWAGMDNEDLFNHNKKLMEKTSPHWIYFTKDVSYIRNSNGFREKSFSDVDWVNSIVLFGCSTVEGVGVAEEDSLPRQLESLMNIPVVNMGIGGAAVDITCWNSTILHDHYPIPRAIVHVWTGLDRYSDLMDAGTYKKLNPTSNDYQIVLNWAHRSLEYIRSDRAMWKNKTFYIEGTYFRGNYDDRVMKFETIDLARDLSHPGIQSHKQAAAKIKERLLEQGFRK